MRSRPSRRRLTAVAAAVVLAGFAALTALLFLWPVQGMPARVDAIVMMDGPGERLATALRLGREDRAPVLVISRGSPSSPQAGACPSL